MDNTFIHPESYDITVELLKRIQVPLDKLTNKEYRQTLHQKLNTFLKKEKLLEELSASLKTGIPTLKDIIENLLRPGRDPREELPKPHLKKDVMNMQDLSKSDRLQI